MAKRSAAKGNEVKPKAGASMNARAARAGKTFEPDGVVTAKVTPKNAEGTKKARGPGRPKKEEPTGNLYSVSYMAGGDVASAPKTLIIQAPDESTAICKANGLNGLGAETHKYQIRATLVNQDGEPLDTDYLPQTELDAGQMAAQNPDDAEEIEDEGDEQDGDE